MGKTQRKEGPWGQAWAQGEMPLDREVVCVKEGGCTSHSRWMERTEGHKEPQLFLGDWSKRGMGGHGGRNH